MIANQLDRSKARKIGQYPCGYYFSAKLDLSPSDDTEGKMSLPVENLKRVKDFITELKPPKFPFAIAQNLAAGGNQVGFVSTGSEAERVDFKYDTSVTAKSNQGHLYGTDLPAEDKKALIEYLTTL